MLLTVEPSWRVLCTRWRLCPCGESGRCSAHLLPTKNKIKKFSQSSKDPCLQSAHLRICASSLSAMYRETLAGRRRVVAGCRRVALRQMIGPVGPTIWPRNSINGFRASEAGRRQGNAADDNPDRIIHDPVWIDLRPEGHANAQPTPTNQRQRCICVVSLGGDDGSDHGRIAQRDRRSLPGFLIVPKGRWVEWVAVLPKIAATITNSLTILVNNISRTMNMAVR